MEWLKKLYRKKKEVNDQPKSKYNYITHKDFDALSEEEKARINAYRQFDMSGTEYLRYKAFSDDHEKCSEGIHSTTGGLGPSVTFVGTGLGYIVTCKCQICGEEADITDIDSW